MGSSIKSIFVRAGQTQYRAHPDQKNDNTVFYLMGPGLKLQFIS